MAGAVQVAESATVLPLADCVVITVNVPQELPLQPGPLSAQVSAAPGFEPGTGVIVATMVVVPPAGTLDGAESCNEKLLVMATTVEIYFEGSATLCAVSVVPGSRSPQSLEEAEAGATRLLHRSRSSTSPPQEARRSQSSPSWIFFRCFARGTACHRQSRRRASEKKKIENEDESGSLRELPVRSRIESVDYRVPSFECYK